MAGSIRSIFYYPEYLWENDRKYVLEGDDGHSGTYAKDVIFDKAIDYVRRQARGDAPFFLYLPTATPHYELLVPEDSLREYRGRFAETPYAGRGPQVGYPYDYAAQSTPRAAIAVMITRMDRNIGRLLASLGEEGIEDHTLVLFTSDNGPSFGPGDPDFFEASGGLRGSKSSLYEGGIRVPLIVRWPGRVEPGAVSDHPSYFPDLMPTFAQAAGIDAPTARDGLSILPTLLGSQANQREHRLMYWEMDRARVRALRMGDWKAVEYLEDGDTVELYDLGGDPLETTDVANEHPDVVEVMRRGMSEEHVDPRPQVEPPKPAGRQYR